jgi:predicted esterase YcpF (UPF0227 family)
MHSIQLASSALIPLRVDFFSACSKILDFLRQAIKQSKGLGSFYRKYNNSKINFRMASTVNPSIQTDTSTSEDIGKQHLDAATGEYVSKSELKRREKQRTKLKEVAEKLEKLKLSGQDTAIDKKEEKNRATEEDEEDIDPNKYYDNRSHWVKQMKRESENLMFPHKFHVSMSLKEFIAAYQNLPAGEHLDLEVSLSGRLFSKRISGTKLLFYDLRNEHEKVQVMAQLQ